MQNSFTQVKLLLTPKVWLILKTSGYYVVKKFEIEISNNNCRNS